VFVTATLGALAFTNAVQGWFVIKNKWYEIFPLLVASLLFFHPRALETVVDMPHYLGYAIPATLYLGVFVLQRWRIGQACAKPEVQSSEP